MIIHEAEFIKSSTNYKQAPTDHMPEYAFIGRSNVGKSSLINMLVNHKGLAKTSSRPGKTRLINHFLINKNWYIVDLPGYGYAKVSKKERSQFSSFTQDYLIQRKTLCWLFALIDCRIPPQKIDIEFLNFCGQNNIPIKIVYTKIDKVSGVVADQNIAAMRKALKKDWAELPEIIKTSAEKMMGRESILEIIESTNQQFHSFPII